MEIKKETHNSIIEKIKSLSDERKLELLNRYSSSDSFSLQYKVVLQLLKDDPVLEKVQDIISSPSFFNKEKAINAYTQSNNVSTKKEYNIITDENMIEKSNIKKESDKFSNMLEKALKTRNMESPSKNIIRPISTTIYTPKI